VAAGHLGQHLGQLDSGGATAADHYGRRAALLLVLGQDTSDLERPARWFNEVTKAMLAPRVRSRRFTLWCGP